MDQILNYIKPELLVLIPVIYFIGCGLKKASWISDKMIPIVLGIIGVLLSSIYVLATAAPEWNEWYDVMIAVFTAIVQGILVAGCSTFINQIYKQLIKDESSDVGDDSDGE